MQSNVYVNDIKKHKTWITSFKKEVHEKKEINKFSNGEFKFKPPKSIEDQLDELSQLCQACHYDKKITIKGYKGNFKLEHWKMIELRLRGDYSIQQIRIIDTKLEEDNLMILPLWFSWVKTKNLIIEFQHNELDDQSVENFIFQLFERNINLDKLFIISNPGVYKGFLLRKLKHYLIKKYEQNPDFYYLLLKNKIKYSLAIIKISRQWQVQKIRQEKEIAMKKIDQTFYFSFHLSNCFNQLNWKGFEHLIQCTYNLETLEQISQLDISDNFLGTQSSFNILCQNLATAKGLISLKLRNQPLFHNTNAIYSLIGDRYDSFRVNHLDISENSNIFEKAFQLLADNIFLKCKSINLDNSLTENNSTLYKISVLTQAYEKQNEQFQQQKQQEKAVLGTYRYKHNLQSLDLSKVENFNRYDQIEILLKVMIFSEHSNVRTHTIQNLDIGRAELYCKALNQFLSEFNVKKTKQKNLQNFKLTLKHLVMLDSEPEYNMNVEVLKQFFLDYLFTKDNSVLEIESFRFVKSFTKQNRKEALKLAAAYILESIHKNPKIKYSLSCLKFFSSCVELDVQTFKCFLLTQNIRLRTFKYFKDEMKGEGSVYLNQIQNFLNEMPETFVHSLQILKLDTITNISFDVGKLISLMIYSPKIQLKEFHFYKIKLTKSSLTLRELDLIVQKLTDYNRILGLRLLKFGDLQGTGEEEFFKYIVFSRFIRLKNLTIKAINFNNLIENLQATIIPRNINPLEELNYLEFEEFQVQTKELWNRLAQIFIFQNKRLKSLIFNSLNLDYNFTLGMTSMSALFIQNTKSLQDSEQVPLLTLTELRFIDCNLSNDFLSFFFPISQVEKLEIIRCKNLTQAMMKVRENYIEEINQFTLKLFTMKDCSISDINLFEWIVENLILNFDRQLLETLNLDNCNLTNDMINPICKQLQLIASKILEYKRIFSLRQINLSNNPDISETQWINIFNSILHLNQPLQLEKVLQSTRQDDIILLINENSQFVTQSLLGLKSKLYYNQQLFKPKFPQQLQQLEIDLEFQNFIHKNNNSQSQLDYLEMKSQIYQRIITGLILFPNSELRKLKLSHLDLDLFMVCCKKSIDFFQKYLESKPDNTLRIQFIKLENIHINQVTTQSRQSIEQFFSLFLCNNQINLKKLSIHGFKEQFLQILLTLCDKRESYQLEKLSIENCEDKLTSDQSNKFLNYFIKGKVFPIKFLTISKGIIFEQIKQFEIQQDNICKIEKLKISVDDKGRNHMSTIYKIFTLLFIQENQLEYLEITTPNADSIFQHIVEICKVQKLKLKSFIINGELSVDMEFFYFIQKSVETLKLLKIFKIIYLKQNDLNYQLHQIYMTPKQGSKLELNKIEYEDTYFLYYNLIFNEMFGFTDLILKDAISFANLQLNYSIYKFRYLKLDMGIEYNSKIQLDVDALTLISSKIIYNEDSILEELVLMNCDLKIPAIKAIVNSAQKLRDRITYTWRQKSFYLTLKRICILHSFHIGQEGMDLLFNNLIYYEYINIERIELQAIELDDKIVTDMIKYAIDWMHFQKRNQRQFTRVFPLRYLDIGKNELFQDKAVWQKFLRTFVFSDKAPYLEILNLHFMALNDVIANNISHNALKYLNSKSSDFKFPLKRLNFSKNNFLTEIGWKDIFNNFIFHPKVYLIELNMTSTQLDSEEKLNSIMNAAKKRAAISKNNLLPLHTLLCYNVTLKTMIAQYLSQKSQQYQAPDDLPIKIDYKCWKQGIFDEIPINLGDQIEILNSLIYNTNELIIPSHIDCSENFKFSQFHLNFLEHYLQVLKLSNPEDTHLIINLATLDQFSNLFRYTKEKPAKPYPYYMIFQRETYIFLSQKENKIKKISLIQADSQSLEKLHQFDVLQIWENIQLYQCQIDQILMEYTLNDDLVEKMLQKGYTERDFISLCRLIPPSNIRIQGTLSLQAIKGLYSILYDTYYFQYSVVDYKFDDFLNIGIGYGLRETAYREVQGNYWSNLIRMTKYNFYNTFVKPTQKYVFDESVKKLNNYLSTKKLNLLLLVLTNFLFFGAAIIAPFFLIEFATQENEQQCQVTKGYLQYYCYAGFAVISALVEGYLYFSISDVIPEYVTALEHAVQFNESEIEITEYKLKSSALDTNIIQINDRQQEQFKEKRKSKIELSIEQFISRIQSAGQSRFAAIINRIIQFFMSQLFKFDLFGDVTFILVLQNCNYNELFYLTIAITAATSGVHFLYFIYLIFKRITKQNRQTQQLSSQYINDFYTIGFQGRNAALSNLLDSIAPYNVSVIPNNKFTRTIVPNQAGKSMSNLVKGYFLQFIFEDLPQIVIQTYFTVSQAVKFEGELEILTYCRIAISFLTVVTSFLKFMSIRPTILVQDDFDKLSDRKKQNYKVERKDLLQQESWQLKKYAQYCSRKDNDQQRQSLDETQPLRFQQS
ncbi:unnamed protein product [Paramecium primaurelia]|uniref:Transmembrane protein n=1 Tax=Paramecium primaurelia TaxID=5886 RepID=A0A8S1NGI8_PARPR|nr:unnamed protein product [Paramecium primaurelia]